jgi:hypothetical protein
MTPGRWEPNCGRPVSERSSLRGREQASDHRLCFRFLTLPAKQLVVAREKLLAAEQHLYTVSLAQFKVIKAITNERVRGPQILSAVRAVKWEIKALDCDLALLYDRAYDDDEESAQCESDRYIKGCARWRALSS